MRSTWTTLVVTFCLTVGLSSAFCALYVRQTSQLSLSDRARFDPAGLSVSGVLLAEYAIGVLGVLAMTGETSTGMIRLSLAAVPRRMLLFLSKAGVFLVVSVAVGLVTTFCSFFAGQAVLSGHTVRLTVFGRSGGRERHAPGRSGSPAAGAVIGSAASSAPRSGSVGLALGAIVGSGTRRAPMEGPCSGLFLLSPVIVSFSAVGGTTTSRACPARRASMVTQVRARVDLLSPTWGAVLLAAYVVDASHSASALVCFIRRGGVVDGIDRRFVHLRRVPVRRPAARQGNVGPRGSSAGELTMS